MMQSSDPGANGRSMVSTSPQYTNGVGIMLSIGWTY
jgi:hypothetical protein